jgi:hypothetical protein
MIQAHTIYNGSETNQPSGKIIVHIQETTWWEWIQDLLGPRNSGEFSNNPPPIRGNDGFMDTRDGPDDPDLPLMSAPCGGALLNIFDTIVVNGNWWELVETLDFHSPPKKIDGIWYYKGEAISWFTHPHLFFTRTNRVQTKIVTWLTRNKINAASDGGLIGGKGDEHWPAVSNAIAAQRRYKLREYPKLPATMILHPESVIVDGNLMPMNNGREITVDAYCFQGSDTFIRSGGKWYLADQMLIRANVELRGPGNGFDYRCFVTMPGKGEPWMGYRGFRSPVCGWVRYE